MKEREALKLAIDRLEWFVDAYPHDITVNKEEFLRPFKEALAQPEQEPVGEAYLCDCCHTPFDGAYECPSCGHNEATKVPVYTTPSQRTWVDLTPEERSNCRYWVCENFETFGRAIEAKLKEKNT